MVRLRCVECGHIWESPLDRKYPRCGLCHSYDVLPEQEYQEILSKCLEIDEKNPRLRLAVLKVILRERGIRLQPLATLGLCEAVLNDLFPPVVMGATITQQGQVYYHTRKGEDHLRKEKKGR